MEESSARSCLVMDGVLRWVVKMQEEEEEEDDDAGVANRSFLVA